MTLNNVTLLYKILPILYNPDGTVVITLRKGFIDLDGSFVIYGQENYFATKEEADTILDAPPTEGLSRRDDLSKALYEFCILKGAQEGVIS